MSGKEICPSCSRHLTEGEGVYSCEACDKDCCTTCTDTTAGFEVICDACNRGLSRRLSTLEADLAAALAKLEKAQSQNREREHQWMFGVSVEAFLLSIPDSVKPDETMLDALRRGFSELTAAKDEAEELREQLSRELKCKAAGYNEIGEQVQQIADAWTANKLLQAKLEKARVALKELGSAAFDALTWLDERTRKNCKAETLNEVIDGLAVALAGAAALKEIAE